MRTDRPFVLLDDAREKGSGRLYCNPVEVISTRDPLAVADCLGRVRSAAGSQLHSAGFLSYEAGYTLEPRLFPLARAAPDDAPPLLWFGFFEQMEQVDTGRLAELFGSSGDAWASPPLPRVTREGYLRAVARVKQHLLDGDIYQANLTFRAEVHFHGEPSALYALLRARSRAGHGALVFTGDHWLLSMSPELFFSLEGDMLTARPMKGTAMRHADPDRDRAAADALATDAKEQAENLMIVDLMRNDLSRVSQPGSVTVPDLFSVEAYPTVHQMTSTIMARLEPDRDAVDVLEAIFPCGSVTGAPKIRAMQIVAELEEDRRRAYTGSIGSIAPSGNASFNVAIRSLSIRHGESKAEMGLGSGIVADSRADEEWRECLAKGRFVNEAASNFDLIETMGFDPHDGILNLERHLARMKNSADSLGFAFDRHDARNELQAATFRFREARKIRLRLSRAGSIAIEARAFPETPKGSVTVKLAPIPASPGDFRLRHKTSDRGFYDEARRNAGTFEVVFFDEDGGLTEGSFTNLFVERDGKLLTPPLSRPLLPGVLREQLIADGEAREAELRAEDLQRGFFLGNALRGLMRARLAE